MGDKEMKKTTQNSPLYDMKCGVEIDHRKAIAMYRAVKGSGAYPRIPEGCNTNWEHFTTVEGQPAIIINQRGFERRPTDGHEQINGCSVVVALDATDEAQARTMLDTWAAQMMPASAGPTFGAAGGRATSDAKTTANRAKVRQYWDDVRAGKRPAPKRGGHVAQKKEWWCTTHRRAATYTDNKGRRCCDPQLDGILIPCNVVPK
jgi:hypothetical protein